MRMTCILGKRKMDTPAAIKVRSPLSLSTICLDFESEVRFEITNS